ncbi:hypothetical protein [Alicyclobacillus sendaiensis]|uniref:Uncharacterized protein n=1 Tax=Alicyclobacillus sendaiensis PA2 TaxID=3029425 RepID=A0ABT6Y146_ALISE|nr:hypothetical protein [Alicyclobacillus sendaiensis]MDI9261068.1 hypothetical protein [Alicyclobacillus sendaiensis PA2]
MEFVLAVFAAWLIYAFLRVHSLGALGLVVLVLAAMGFLVFRYRRTQLADSDAYGEEGDDEEEW